MKPIFCTIASLALLSHFSSGQILIDDAMEGYPTATAASVYPGAAIPNPSDWQSLVFSGSGSVGATAGVGLSNGKTGRAATMNSNFSAAGSQYAGHILNSHAYTTAATSASSLSDFHFTVDLRGSQAAAVTVEFLSFSIGTGGYSQMTGSMAKTFTLSAANTYQTFSGDLGQTGWAPDSSKISGAPLILNAPRYSWTVIVHAGGTGGWGFDAGNTLDIDNIKLTATKPTTTYLPVTYDANGFFNLNSGQSSYIGYKPDSYSHSTPTSLFVWMHGCGGNAAGDMWTIAPPATRQTQSYIAISIGGRDGACWSVNSDSTKVLAAIDDIARYFNINPRKIFLGGYSSGGDLAYRVGFQNASRFAGLLVENSDPFRDTGATGTQLMSSASWKINIAHLAHLSDATYPISTVRTNVASLNSNGFPATLIEKAGAHYNADNGSFGTNYDLKTFLLPYLDAGWQSPVANTLSFSTDVDGDGLSDAAEFAWKELGFDWQTSQPILVAEFLANATRAGLYTQSQLQALSVGTPLIACDPITGKVKMTIGLKKSVDLVNFNSLPLSTGTTAINGNGDLEFTFSPPDKAAFFRLQAR